MSSSQLRNIAIDRVGGQSAWDDAPQNVRDSAYEWARNLVGNQAYERQSKAVMMGVKLDRLKYKHVRQAHQIEGIKTYGPIIAIIVFFVIAAGLGMTTILAMFDAVGWWMWVAIIFVLILVFKRR